MGLFIDEACPRAIGQQSPCFLLLLNPERGSGSAVSRARGYRNMVKFELFQKRFPQSAHKQEYRGGGCGDRGVVTSTPYLVPAPPTSPSFAPNPNS